MSVSVSLRFPWSHTHYLWSVTPEGFTLKVDGLKQEGLKPKVPLRPLVLQPFHLLPSGPGFDLGILYFLTFPPRGTPGSPRRVVFYALSGPVRPFRTRVWVMTEMVKPPHPSS